MTYWIHLICFALSFISLLAKTADATLYNTAKENLLIIFFTSYFKEQGFNDIGLEVLKHVPYLVSIRVPVSSLAKLPLFSPRSKTFTSLLREDEAGEIETRHQ